MGKRLAERQKTHTRKTNRMCCWFGHRPRAQVQPIPGNRCCGFEGRIHVCTDMMNNYTYLDKGESERGVKGWLDC